VKVTLIARIVESAISMSAARITPRRMKSIILERIPVLREAAVQMKMV
jgi:hypothetical protein